MKDSGKSVPLLFRFLGLFLIPRRQHQVLIPQNLSRDGLVQDTLTRGQGVRGGAYRTDQDAVPGMGRRRPAPTGRILISVAFQGPILEKLDLLLLFQVALASVLLLWFDFEG